MLSSDFSILLSSISKSCINYKKTTKFKYIYSILLNLTLNLLNFLNGFIINFRVTNIRIKKLTSKQYRAWSDCTVRLAWLYTGDMMTKGFITFGSSMVMVNPLLHYILVFTSAAAEDI